MRNKGFAALGYLIMFLGLIFSPSLVNTPLGRSFTSYFSSDLAAVLTSNWIVFFVSGLMALSYGWFLAPRHRHWPDYPVNSNDSSISFENTVPKKEPHYSTLIEAERLVAMKCPNCGGGLQFGGNSSTVCGYCGAEVVKQEGS